jgi:hypothetical protein
MARIRIRTCLILKSRIRTKIVRIRNTDIFFSIEIKNEIFPHQKFLWKEVHHTSWELTFGEGKKNFL